MAEGQTADTVEGKRKTDVGGKLNQEDKVAAQQPLLSSRAADQEPSDMRAKGPALTRCTWLFITCLCGCGSTLKAANPCSALLARGPSFVLRLCSYVDCVHVSEVGLSKNVDRGKKAFLKTEQTICIVYLKCFCCQTSKFAN